MTGIGERIRDPVPENYTWIPGESKVVFKDAVLGWVPGIVAEHNMFDVIDGKETKSVTVTDLSGECILRWRRENSDALPSCEYKNRIQHWDDEVFQMHGVYRAFLRTLRYCENEDRKGKHGSSRGDSGASSEDQGQRDSEMSSEEQKLLDSIILGVKEGSTSLADRLQILTTKKFARDIIEIATGSTDRADVLHAMAIMLGLMSGIQVESGFDTANEGT